MWIKSAIRFESGDTFVSSLCDHMAERIGSNGALNHNRGESLHDHDDILRQSPPTLISAAFTDRLKMLSPRTWWGMIDLESKKGVLSSFDISTTVRSAVGLMIPLLVVCVLRLAIVRRNQSPATIPSPRLLIATFLSPWSLQCLYHLFYQLYKPLETFRTMTNIRSSTLSRATDTLKLRIRHLRAYRTRRYDVYLPPSLEGFSDLTSLNKFVRDDDVDDRTLRALLFIPGAAVAHEAYSEVAARLSDKGFVVAVMSLEPFRLANRYFGANLASVKRIIEEITSDIHCRAIEVCMQSYDDEALGNQTVDKLSPRILPAKSVEWTLMGHSMGAFGAMQLFRAFCDNSWNNKQTISRANTAMSIVSTIDIVLGNKLVLWGVAAFVESATDLSDQKDAEILVIQGTNDELVDLMRSRQGELESLFPTATRTEHIAGGTHEGFGSYQSNFRLYNNGETKKSKRSIPLDKQHKRVCDETVQFLRSLR